MANENRVLLIDGPIVRSVHFRSRNHRPASLFLLTWDPSSAGGSSLPNCQTSLALSLVKQAIGTCERAAEDGGMG